MKEKFTKGEWKFKPEKGVMHAILCAGSKMLAIFKRAPSEADARLIASAPDLYKALDELVSTVVVDDEEGLAVFSEPMQKAIKALSKARGEGSGE